MSDPWADERERATRARGYVDEGFPAWNWHVYSLDDAERLLTDADALLAKSRATDEFWNWFSDLNLDIWGVNQPEVTDNVNRFEAALAALPEHLRGDTNERSRKA